MFDELESLFARHFVRSGSLCAVDCVCGRTHFVTAQGHGDYEEGELAGYIEKAKQHPDRYIESNVYDTIDTVIICGEEYVIPCPCNRARMLASFLVRHADSCASFLSEHLQKQAKAAAEKRERCLNLCGRLSLWRDEREGE